MKNSFLKKGTTSSLYVVEQETGIVLEESVITAKYLAKTKEEFYLVYSTLLGVFQKLNMPEVRTYCYLIAHYQVGSNIGITAAIRRAIGKATDISAGTVANALGNLTEKKLIYSTERGVYKLNPRYAFQGSTADRNKMLKFILEVECPEC